MKQRNHAFDLLCGICIIRMMMLHITNACGFGNDEWWTRVMQWSYYFMSFFFFKAGYFNKTVSGDSKSYCIDKFKRLMIPYFVWGFIGNIIYFFFVIFVLDPANAMSKQVTWDYVFTTGEFHGNVPCWFLLSFFIAYIVAHFISKVPPLFHVEVKGRKLNFKIHWFLLVFPYVSYYLFTLDNPVFFGLNNVFIGIYLFYLGRLWHFIMEKLKRRYTIPLSLFMIVMFVVLNIIYSGGYQMSENLWEGNPFIVTLNVTLSLCGLSGILLNINMKRIPVINYVGQHSMVFFVAHYPMLTFYKMVRSANVHTLRGHWDDYVILVAVLFSVCFLLVPHIESVPWLSGRFKKKA
ncbi:MAG: acyltransferase [Bacteroidaceae bacterium]|nr:acyltransferase [Bacteroidaceae bacterium]